MSGNDDIVESLVARLRALGLGAGVPDDSVDRPQLTPTVRVSLDKALGLLRGRDRPDKASHLLRRDMAKRGRLNTRKKGKAKNGAKWGHNFTPKTLPHDC